MLEIFENFKKKLKVGQNVYTIGVDTTNGIFDTVTIRKNQVALIEERPYGLYCVDEKNNLIEYGYLTLKEAVARANNLIESKDGKFNLTKIKYINCEEEKEEKEKVEEQEYNLFAFL